MIFRLLLFWLLAVVSLAAQPEVDAALQKLRPYQFGGDRAPVDAIEQAVTASLANPDASRPLAAKLANFLLGEGTYDAKQFVCRQLVLIATDSEIPTLTALLRTNQSTLVVTARATALAIEPGDPQLAHLALYVLRGLSGPAVDHALRDVLRETGGATRVEVLHVLGQRRASSAVKAITPLLAHPDTATANAAAVALGHVGTTSVIKPLLRAFAKAGSNCQPTLAEALLRAAEILASSGDTSTASSVATRLLKDAPGDRLQAAALRLLVLARGEKATDAVLEAFSEDGTALQSMAAQAARQLPGKEATCALAHLLPTRTSTCDCRRRHHPPALAPLSATAQSLVLAALADRGDATAQAAVLEMSLAPDEAVATAAIAALGVLGNNERAVDTLLQLAAQTQPAIRTAARDALDALRGPAVPIALAAALEHAKPALQVEAIRTLGNRGTTTAVPALLRSATASPDRAVRTAALRVLRDLASPADLPALVDRLLAAPAAERPDVAATIAATARRATDDRTKTAALLERLPKATAPDQQTTLLSALGEIGGAPALAALRQALGDSHADIRLAALRQLAAWPTEEPLPDLLHTAKSSIDDQQRAVALRGYIRLLGNADRLSTTDALARYREAMDLSKTPEEKRAVLAGLARVTSREALEYAASFTRDESLRAEAELAVADIGRGTLGAWRDATLTALRPVAENSINTTAKTRAAEVLALATKLGDFITAWQVSPAYSQPGVACNQLFDIPFAPEIPDQANAVPWRVMPAALNAEQPWLMDLLALHGGEQKVAYLRARVVAKTAQPAVLAVGSDDGIKVWLNGKVVFANNTQRAVAPAQERVSITLNAGANDLLLKITQNVMGWGAVALLHSPDGGAPPGVHVELP